jgi:hypothetical protein
VACGTLLAAAAVGRGAELATNLLTKFSKEERPVVQQIVKEYAKLAWAWQTAMQDQEAVCAASIAFGVQARRAAEKRLPELHTAAQTSAARFTTECDIVRKTLAKRLDRLRDQAFRLRESSPDSPELPRRDTEIVALDGKLRTLESMGYLLSTGLQRIPTTSTLIGIAADDKEIQTLAAKYPALVEARKRVEDCKADLKALDQAPAGGTLTQRKTLETALAKAQAAFDAEAAKAGKGQKDGVAKLRKKIEAVEKQ